MIGLHNLDQFVAKNDYLDVFFHDSSLIALFLLAWSVPATSEVRDDLWTWMHTQRPSFFLQILELVQISWLTIKSRKLIFNCLGLRL